MTLSDDLTSSDHIKSDNCPPYLPVHFNLWASAHTVLSPWNDLVLHMSIGQGPSPSHLLQEALLGIPEVEGVILIPLVCPQGDRTVLT